jgi:PA14 domain-containing protein/dolichyl-phosphate-mannose-protein mannosyltransferase
MGFLSTMPRLGEETSQKGIRSSKAVLRIGLLLLLGVWGAAALLLLVPQTGLHGVYSSVSPSGAEVVISTRLDTAVDFASPQILLSPFYQHWDLARLPVPASLPPFQVRWTGYLNATAAGRYAFAVESAGQVRLLLDGQPLTPSEGQEGSSALATMAAGWHALDLTYRRDEEEPGIRLLWQPPGSAMMPLSSDWLAPSELSIRERVPRAAAGVILSAAWLFALWSVWRGRSKPESLGRFVAEHRHATSLACIVLLGAVLRIYQYDLIPFHHETADEYQHGWEGWTLLHEGTPAAWTFYPQSYPTENISPFRWFGDSYYLARPYFDHPPGFSLIVGATCTMMGAGRMLECTLHRMRCVPILFGLLTIVLVARTGWRFIPDRSVGTMASLVYATLPVIVLGNRLVKAENLLAPLLLAQVSWLAGYLRNNNRRDLLKTAAGGALSIWLKATGIAAPLVAVLLLSRQRRGRALSLVAGAATLAVALYLFYGAYFGWELFTSVLGLQASKRVAVRTLLDLTGISRVVELQFGSGWYLWLAVATAWMAFGKYRELLLPAAVYLGILGLTADTRGVFGWYRLPLYPFLCLAGGLFLVEWWRDKDFARGFLFAVTGLACSLSYALPIPAESSRMSVFSLLFLVSAGPLWVMLRPSAAATRMRNAAVAVCLMLFFAANLIIVARQVPIYLREGARGKLPGAASSSPP